MTAHRIFRTDRPSLICAPVRPLDPRDAWALEELRRRRAAKAREEGAQCAI